MKIEELKKDYPKLGALAESLINKDFMLYDYFLEDNYLVDAFCWKKSPQGHDYWNEVHLGKNIKEKESEISQNTKSDLNYDGLENVSEAPKRYESRKINGMDVIDLIKYWNLNFNEGNILKYLLRNKGEDLSDMKKIEDYANREYSYLKTKI